MNRREMWPLLGGGLMGGAMLASTAGAAAGDGAKSCPHGGSNPVQLVTPHVVGAIPD